MKSDAPLLKAITVGCGLAKERQMLGKRNIPDTRNVIQNQNVSAGRPPRKASRRTPAKIRRENFGKTSENILKDEVIPIAELPALRGLVTLRG